MRNLFAALALAWIVSLNIADAAADELAETGREVVEKNREAVVTIKLVIKESMSFGSFGSDESEMVSEATGSVIREDGLIVASLASTDPNVMFEAMFEELAGEDLGFSFSIDSNLSDVTIILSDGQELPAEVVLRDRVLDLIFLRPTEKPEGGFTVLSPGKNVKIRQFDSVVVLRRLGKVADRQLSGSFERIAAVMTRPRTMYVLTDMNSGMSNVGLGQPVFDRKGHFIGMSVLRMIKSTSATGMFGGDFGSNTAVVIVPVVDILEAAEQAPWE